MMDGWQTVNYIDNILCEHETEWCQNHRHCTTCSYYKTGNLTTKKYMTNADRIRNMSDEELVDFIDLESPSCSEFCDDFGSGCYFKCKHNKGRDILLKWLKTPVEE